MKPDSDLGLPFQIMSIPFFQHFHPCHRRCRSQDRTILLVLVGEQCCGIETFGLVVALRYTNGSLKRQLLGLRKAMVKSGGAEWEKEHDMYSYNQWGQSQWICTAHFPSSIKTKTYYCTDLHLLHWPMRKAIDSLNTLSKFHGEYHPPRIPPVSRPCKLGTYSQANDHSWPAGRWIPKTKLLKLREYTVFIRFWIVVFLGRLKFRIVFKEKANFKD